MPPTNSAPLVVDAVGLAAMIDKSHRTVMVLCAREAWRCGRLPAPTYGPGTRETADCQDEVISVVEL